jgi:hypothetical protein
MTDITIPPAALEAGVKAFAEAEDNDYTSRAEDLAAAFLAMLQAWPRALEQQFYELTADGRRLTFPVIILPLPQEASDAG